MIDIKISKIVKYPLLFGKIKLQTWLASISKLDLWLSLVLEGADLHCVLWVLEHPLLSIWKLSIPIGYSEK